VNEPKLDLASNAELQKGLVLLSHCRGARGIGVRPFRAATVCEFEPALETDRVMQSGSDHGSRSCMSSRLIEPTLCDSRSLLANIFGETTRRASRTYASRMPASLVLRILDPRLALALFVANTKWRHIDGPETARRIKTNTRCSNRNSCPTEPHPTPTKALDARAPM